jgi:vancomycin resistance protein YoaR
MRVYRFEEPVEQSLGSRRPSAKRRRRFPFATLLILLALVGIVVGTAAYLGRDTGATIPVGTRIDGVDVGDLTAAEAKAKVRAHGQALVARGVVLLADGNRFEIDPASINLRPNAQAAVKAAQEDSTFLERLQGRVGLGSTRDIPLAYLYNRRQVGQALLPVRQATTVPPRNATVIKDARGRFPVRAAAKGARPNVGEILLALRSIGETGPDLQVPITITEPAVTTAEAEQAATAARDFVRSPHFVTLKDDPRRVPRSVALKATEFVAQDGTISFDISGATLRNFFSTVYGKREKAPKNATFTTNAAGKARIIGSTDGRGVDVDTLAATWKADPTERITPISIGVRRPALTSEMAQQLGVKEVVGEFFTPYSGGARVSNIKRGAEILDQYIIPAGGTFSLNKALGERTLARGFVEAPMIGENNILKDAVGGGVSQIATTMFNAAFFAGLKLIDHTPHSFWISRYPKGREATVSWGGPELIFENNWEAPIVILTRTDAEGITIKMLSDPLGRKVTDWTGEPYSISKAKTQRIKDPSLPPGEVKIHQSKGSDGFHIKYGRRVFKDGKLQSKQSWHWRYFPEDAVIMVGPRKPPGGGGAAPVEPTTTTTATEPADTATTG